MPVKVIREYRHIDQLCKMLQGKKLPMTITIAQGEPRSGLQNKLAQRWFTDIANHLGDQTHEDVRAECKLRFGVPILRAENEAFKISYDQIIKPLPYEQKLEAIKAFDLPVTRLMTTKQMKAFMDEMQIYWLKQSVPLTDPQLLKYEQEFT